jgi:hypothetical protein
MPAPRGVRPATRGATARQRGAARGAGAAGRVRGRGQQAQGRGGSARPAKATASGAKPKKKEAGGAARGGRGRGGKAAAGGAGRGGKANGKKTAVSKEDLDAELDKYHGKNPLEEALNTELDDYWGDKKGACACARARVCVCECTHMFVVFGTHTHMSDPLTTRVRVQATRLLLQTEPHRRLPSERVRMRPRSETFAITFEEARLVVHQWLMCARKKEVKKSRSHGGGRCRLFPPLRGLSGGVGAASGTGCRAPGSAGSVRMRCESRRAVQVVLTDSDAAVQVGKLLGTVLHACAGNARQ